MIIFQVREGVFGQRGWRNVHFWKVWLPAWLGGCVTRIVIGSEISIGELKTRGYNWFDKRIARDNVYRLSMADTGLDLKEWPSDLVKAYKERP